VTKPNPSQSHNEPQNDPPAFDPAQAFARLSQDAVARMQAFYDELARWEGKAYERATQANEQLAAMASDTMTYLTQLGAEWRALTLEATRRGADILRPRA